MRAHTHKHKQPVKYQDANNHTTTLSILPHRSAVDNVCPMQLTSTGNGRREKDVAVCDGGAQRKCMRLF